MGKITVVFNNVSGREGLKLGRGSSILIEHNKEVVLYDTGPSAEDLLFNLKELKIDINNIQKVVISHKHKDHGGGLEEFLKYRPKIKLIEESRKIANDIYVKRVKHLKSEENVLVIDSSQGLIILAGCAHPGIYKICRQIKGDFGKDIYAVMGGFHFEYYPPIFVKVVGHLLKNLGIEILGPNHCTGEKAIEVLRRIFKNGFIDFGCGKSFEY